MFQSLFCWKFLLGFTSSCLRVTSSKVVSILVLLEVPLRPGGGLRAEAARDVSILVLLEVPLRPRRARIRGEAVELFQSLFCWKFLLGYVIQSHMIETIMSFNPCFAGSSS